MSEERFNQVLRRMLNTPPAHKREKTMARPGRRPAEETVSDETRREIRRDVAHRLRLTEEASELTNTRLAARHGVPVSFVQRIASRVARGADPAELYRQLQNRLAEDLSADWMLFRCEDGVTRIKPMDTSQITRDGFLGTVNASTRVADIEAMLDD